MLFFQDAVSDDSEEEGKCNGAIQEVKKLSRATDSEAATLKICEELVSELMLRTEAWPFLKPVNKKDVNKKIFTFSVNIFDRYCKLVLNIVIMATREHSFFIFIIFVLYCMFGINDNSSKRIVSPRFDC